MGSVSYKARLEVTHFQGSTELGRGWQDITEPLRGSQAVRRKGPFATIFSRTSSFLRHPLDDPGLELGDIRTLWIHCCESVMELYWGRSFVHFCYSWKMGEVGGKNHT